MNEQTKADIILHAREEFPREACGLLTVWQGKERYKRCRNIAVGTDQFVIHPQDYAQAEIDSDIIAVVHSHPNLSPEPSQSDRVACAASGLPWHIVSVPSQQWAYMEPEGYQAPLIGREWSHGVLDCYAIIRDWFQLERGITLPDFSRHDEWWLRGENLYMENFGSAGFTEVTRDRLQPGDVILMRIFSPVPNHGAVYLGDNQIIHHVQNRLSCREPYGIFWRNRSTHFLRHENNHSAG
jgi:proteasome lid subunit RPN8/RPN11